MNDLQEMYDGGTRWFVLGGGDPVLRVTVEDARTGELDAGFLIADGEEITITAGRAE